MKSSLLNVVGITWRSIIVGVGYVVALLVGGIIPGLLGVPMSSAPDSELILFWVLLTGIVMSLFLGPLASRMQASGSRHIWVWSMVIFFNMGSVAIEGAIFAPGLATVPLPVLFAQQLLASAAAAFLIYRLFAKPGASPALAGMLRVHPWYSWLWRFVAASISYLVFYYLFGTINYTLVTEPYYTSHAGGLMTPAASLVLMTESIRAPLIVLSAGVFVLTFRANRRRTMLITGVMLFWIGGVAPLLLQAGSLPAILLVASGVEIFFQNFFTGLVTAWLLWTPFTKE